MFLEPGLFYTYYYCQLDAEIPLVRYYLSITDALVCERMHVLMPACAAKLICVSETFLHL